MGRSAHRPRNKDANAPGLPPILRERLASMVGNDVHALEAALSASPPTSIRLNPRKPFAMHAAPVPWCAHGRYLDERPAFTLDPLLHAGAYYVQEASSMLIEQAVIASRACERDILALDLCAAPGGKSTHMLSLLTEGSLLVANEPDGARRRILAENIWKHGAVNAMITGSDPSDLRTLPGHFDLVLVDAPCSGEGMFRKDPFAREQWSPALVESCAAAQRSIVEHAWHSLAPGGTLIYSTCTWEPLENEAQLAPLVAQGATSVELRLDPIWGVASSAIHGVIGYRCYPHRVRGEGFFLSVLTKPGALQARRTTDEGEARAVWPWISAASACNPIELHDVRYALPSRWSAPFRALQRTLRVHAPGTPFAERKGEAWVPHPAAALSQALDRSAFPHIQLDLGQAIAYLSGEALASGAASGIALVTYEGFALGWAHGVGRRWNNRWPGPWRIRSQRSSAPRVSWQGS